jgi:hypothetical protein
MGARLWRVRQAGCAVPSPLPPPPHPCPPSPPTHTHTHRSLLSDMGARLWRVRQAGCAGLTDLLAGRRWAQLGPHMEQVGRGGGVTHIGNQGVQRAQ